MYTPDALRLRARKRELAILLASAFAGFAMSPVEATAGTVLPVTSCADDGGPGTLRSVMLAAPQDALIDLTGLTCDRIVLTQGVIDITATAHDMTVQGPGADRLAIDGRQNGAIFRAFSLEVDGLTLTNGRVSGDVVSGGCISVASTVVMRSSRVTACSAYGTQYAAGGGIEAAYGVALYSTTVSYNSAFAESGRAQGGGINATYTAVTVTDSTITGNSAGGSTGSAGGGVYALGFSGITRSTIDHNAADQGGGWYCHSSFFQAAYCSVENSTISGNIARDSGGGLMVSDARAKVVIDNSTIADNTAQLGHVGGVLLTGTTDAEITLQSSIFSNNSAAAADLAPDLDTDLAEFPTVTGGDDLLMTVGRIQPFRAIIGDPLLAPLADNGGPTWTHALLPGSPAIDAGNNVADLATDQRGRTRVSGAAADIGAFEVQADAIFADGFD
jgi:hypothetical protein